MIRSLQRMKQKRCKSPNTPRSKVMKQIEGIDVTAEQERRERKSQYLPK